MCVQLHANHAGITLSGLAAEAAEGGIDIKFLGSMLFSRCVSGTRVIVPGELKSICDVDFIVSKTLFGVLDKSLANFHGKDTQYVRAFFCEGEKHQHIPRGERSQFN